jgi:hypothetical protein
MSANNTADSTISMILNYNSFKQHSSFEGSFHEQQISNFTGHLSGWCILNYN